MKMKSRSAFMIFGVLAMLSLSADPSSSGVIETYAGDGTRGYSGDGGPATQASFNSPSDVAVDDFLNLYLADLDNCRVRRVESSGRVTTVAGNGIPGYGGDGGPATQASLYLPMGVVLDGGGNLYIADHGNNRIRKVDTAGIITTVAGNGGYGYSGDGVLATQASLWGPQGIAVDNSGNLFIADSANYRVRKVDTAGIITTVAGNGVPGNSGDGGPATQASFCQPGKIAVDGIGNIYISDAENYRVRKVDTAGIITTVAGNGGAGYSGDGGPATQATLRPYGLVVDSTGDLYIGDFGNNRIRRVDANGIITTVAGNGIPGYGGDGGPATQASIYIPEGIAVDGLGDLYISDYGNFRVRWVNEKPHASFAASPNRGYRNQNFAFINTTRTASGTTYVWDFGDYTASAETSPSHFFLDEGIYTISLTATGSSGLPADSTNKTMTDYICAGYIFSNDPATSTTAPFARIYVLGGRLYARVWVLPDDVDFMHLKSAILTIKDALGTPVKSDLTHEGSGVFSGSVLLDSGKLIAGPGTAMFTIKDRTNRTFTATESISLQ